MKQCAAALAAIFVCVTLGASGAAAQDDENQVLQDAMAFAMHDAAFTVYHEVGHMLVGELGLPVLGKEEDAVDTLATIWLLNDEDQDYAFNALIDASDGWYYNAVNSTGSGVDEFSYYDEHSLDIQRAYAMVCLMVGADPDNFGETADIYELDPDQQENCAYTYEQALASWGTLLSAHELNGNESAPIEVIYEDAGDFEEFAVALKEEGVLERAADEITSSYALPQPVTFRATQCGEANAYYDPSASEVTYCYELAAEMYNLYVYDIAGWGDTGEDTGLE